MVSTGNPIFSKDKYDGVYNTSNPITLKGALNKGIFLSLLLLLTIVWVWSNYHAEQEIEFLPVNEDTRPLLTVVMIGLIGGFSLTLVTTFMHEWAWFTAPMIAVFAGLFLGGISTYHTEYYGIAMHAVQVTFGTLFVLLVLHRLGIMRARGRTSGIVAGFIIATVVVALMYLVDFYAAYLGIKIPFLHSSLFGIGITVYLFWGAVTTYRSDFYFIEERVAEGAPKYMEWYSAFGLLTSLFWVYLGAIISLTYYARLLTRRRF